MIALFYSLIVSDDRLFYSQACFSFVYNMDGEIMDQLMGKYMHQHVLR